MQWTLSPFQGAGTRPHGTLGELRLGHAGQTLEVIVARGTKVCGTETVVDGNRATIATLVLQEICAVFWTHLQGSGEEKMEECGVTYKLQTPTRQFIDTTTR